jgi:hypothetical protein
MLDGISLILKNIYRNVLSHSFETFSLNFGFFLTLITYASNFLEQLYCGQFKVPANLCHDKVNKVEDCE